MLVEVQVLVAQRAVDGMTHPVDKIYSTNILSTRYISLDQNMTYTKAIRKRVNDKINQGMFFESVALTCVECYSQNRCYQYFMVQNLHLE